MDIIQNDQRSSTLTSLESIRNQLLDMSNRNDLLSFSLTSKSSKRIVRIVDYSLSDLVHQLVIENKSFIFKPVEEPDEEEYSQVTVRLDNNSNGENRQKFKKKPTAEGWANHLGGNTSFDLPLTPQNGRPKRVLKALHYPGELEKRLHNISRSRDNDIQETGINNLHLACGFLERYDTETSDKVFYSPLYLIPVSLTRDTLDPETQTYKYSLEWNNDDIHSNVSLQEKIKQEFGLQIPEIGEMPVEEYLERIRELLSKQSNHPVLKRWIVHNYAALSFFKFTGIAMYHDLDPERWPEDQALDEHSIINRFLSSSEVEGNSGEFQSEYNIDRLEDIHRKFPLIDDADSSQHSALVDVLIGKNLVIEGPPGTGKSQTITNIIAACLAQDKKVLFVSAKQAALDVVQNRLERAELGEFCLTLHGRTIQKGQLLKSIRQRIEKEYVSSNGLKSDISRLEEHKGQLLKYADTINSSWKSTELSPHEILSRATYLRDKIKISPEFLHPTVHGGTVLTPSTRKKIIDTAHEIAVHYKQLKTELGNSELLSDHPWYGVTRSQILPKDYRVIKSSLQNYNERLAQVQELLEEFEGFLEINSGSIQSFHDIEKVAKDLGEIPKGIDGSFHSMISGMTSMRFEVLTKYLNTNSVIRSQLNQLPKKFHNANESEFGRISDFKKIGENLLDVGLNRETCLPELDSIAQLVGQVCEESKVLLEPLSQIRDQIKNHPEDFLEPSIKGLKELCQLIGVVCQLPPDLWSWRDPQLESIEASNLLPKIRKKLQTINKVKDDLSKYFNLDKASSEEQLESMRVYFSHNCRKKNHWFSLSWWKNSRKLKRIAAHSSCKLSTCPITTS